jgi:pimeloyl-ACP methyl ester carboxylesterase
MTPVSAAISTTTSAGVRHAEGISFSWRDVVIRGFADQPVVSRVEESGSGDPVVFLHGLVGLNDHWEDVVRRIHHRSKCYLVQMPLLDLRSDDCSIGGATELTARLIEEHLGRGCVLVGNSFGGHIATRLAIERPELVRGLVLAGASGLIEKSMVSDVQIRPSREWLERKIGELFFDRSKMNYSDVDRAYNELSERGRAKAMIKLSRSARRNHLGDRLHQISSPTLIIWGKQDIVTPPEACEQFHAKIKGSKVCWLERCGHVPMIECPEEFGREMNLFLDSLPARSSVAHGT